MAVHNHLPIPLLEIRLSNGLLRQNQGYLDPAQAQGGHF